jgi:hypothetical protein
MPTRINPFLLSAVIAVACACDTPMGTDVLLQGAEWDGHSIAATVGETFNLDQLMGTDVENAGGGAPIARPVYDGDSDDWKVTCLASGAATLEVRLMDGTHDPQEIICREAAPIEYFHGHWLNLNAYFGVATIGVSTVGNATALQVRNTRGPAEVMCTAFGDYRYVIIQLPGSAPRWYEFKCVFGMPLAPLPPPRVSIPVNVSAAFRLDGWVVDGVETWPADLADAAVINASLSPAGWTGARLARPHGAAVAADAGDFFLTCKRTGEGTIRVLLEPGYEPEYRLICHPTHEQGSGG